MDLLRQTAVSIYDAYDNFDASSAAELKIVRIDAESGDPDTATYEIEDASEADVLSRISSALAPKSETRREHAGSTTASLLLVSMWTSSNGDACEGIGISKAKFLGLIDALDIDRSALQPIVNNAFGLLDFSEPTSRSVGGSTSTYFLGDTRMELIWSFNFATSETKGILIARRGPLDFKNRRPNHPTVGGILASLSQQRRNIFNPYTLLFVALVQSTREAKPRATQSDRAGVFGRKTGYNDGGRPVAKPNNQAVSSGTTLESLTMAVTHIEALTASLATDERQIDTIDFMLDALSDQGAWRQQLDCVPWTVRRIELCERDMRVFSAVLHPLRQQNAAARSALRCVAAQTRSQSDAVSIRALEIFTLRAQEEARMNRDMAEASREIAEAAKRDTASMKTIAVMTMAFLPGTFFAALFSLPSLRWDQADVVTDRFWVYWVFTLPVTAFVFLIWMVLSYDDGFRTALDGYQRRKSAKSTKSEHRNNTW
ncbi:hypothetical protein F5X98DRAFT_357031 [Xylaria grammica]|nr:hypothetical protein F5X98DRAFT_357031 [Xylaria grammica]